MDIITAFLLILGGVIALSGLIAIRRPDLRPKLEALIAFKALIGVGLLITGIITFAQYFSLLADSFKMNQIFAAAIWCMVIGAILLGALFGWPIIASMVPDTSPAKPKIQNLTTTIEAFQVLIGAAGILAAIVYLLFRFKILGMQNNFIEDLPI